MHARRLARPSSVCARRAANICPIASIDLAENFIDSRKHSVDNLGHLAPQGIEFDSQLLYIPLAFFAATIEIAHAPPRYPSSTKLLKQPAQIQWRAAGAVGPKAYRWPRPRRLHLALA